jgi:hypothetical protein
MWCSFVAMVVVAARCGRHRPEAVVVAAATPQIWSQMRLDRPPLYRSLVLGFWWADLDLCRLIIRRPSWWGFGHRYDFDWFVVVFFLGNGDLDHII